MRLPARQCEAAARPRRHPGGYPPGAGRPEHARRRRLDRVLLHLQPRRAGRVWPAAGEYLLPVDTDYSSSEAVARTAIAGGEFTEALRAITARKMLVAFDCCHSGGIGQPK